MSIANCVKQANPKKVQLLTKNRSFLTNLSATGDKESNEKFLPEESIL